MDNSQLLLLCHERKDVKMQGVRGVTCCWYLLLFSWRWFLRDFMGCHSLTLFFQFPNYILLPSSVYSVSLNFSLPLMTKREDLSCKLMSQWYYKKRSRMTQEEEERQNWSMKLKLRGMRAGKVIVRRKRDINFSYRELSLLPLFPSSSSSSSSLLVGRVKEKVKERGFSHWIKRIHVDCMWPERTTGKREERRKICEGCH